MANNDPPGIRYLTEEENKYTRGTFHLNQNNSRFYMYITKNAKVYLVAHDNWMIDNPGTYAFVCEYNKKLVFMNQVQGLVPGAYAVYEYPIPTNINTVDAVAEYFKTVRPKAFLLKDEDDAWQKYELDPFRSITKGENFSFDGYVLTGYASFTAELLPMSRGTIGVRLGLQEYRLDDPDEMHNDIKSITIFKPDGIFHITENLTPVSGFVPIPKKYFVYDAKTNTYSLEAMIAATQKDHHPKIGDLVVSGVLDFSQFSFTPYPGVRYIQIGDEKTVVGFGNNWYDRPTIASGQSMGTLKYTAKDNSIATSVQTTQSLHPGSYHYLNDRTSQDVYPKVSTDGSAVFTFSWDSATGLQDHTARLYEDPYIPELYSIRPNHDYTNVCHDGHVATSNGSHWFALPGRLVETANLGTNVDYTDRRNVLMEAASRLAAPDDFVGDYWEKGRFVVLDYNLSYHGTSKTGTAVSMGVKSQVNSKPYNYYYGNSFLKNSGDFSTSPTNINVSVDYVEEDKLPAINQDFTTNCGPNNRNRELSDWTISRIYYDHKKRLRFGPEDSNYSRTNYRGAVRNLTPDGIAPLVGGVATLVNGGTIRVPSGTSSLFTNVPQCSVIKEDIIVDATGNDSEIPFELYKRDAMIAGVMIMRGRILIKGSSNPNPLIGINSPTLIVNETHWDLDQLFDVISEPTSANYRVVGGYLITGNGIIFVEDKNNMGIPAVISSMSDVTTINIGRTSLSDKPIFAIAGNIYNSAVPNLGYSKTTGVDTDSFLGNISDYLKREIIQFRYNGYESISYPYYMTPYIRGDSAVGAGYPEEGLRKNYDNHGLYIYDLTGKFHYSDERKGRYRKEFNWYYDTGTAVEFRNFVMDKIRNDDNRELINAKRVIVSYLNHISGPTYKMVNSIEAALRDIPWVNDVDIRAKIYAFD